MKERKDTNKQVRAVEETEIQRENERRKKRVCCVADNNEKGG